MSSKKRLERLEGKYGPSCRACENGKPKNTVVRQIVGAKHTICAGCGRVLHVEIDISKI
jgi:hypothetical protein